MLLLLCALLAGHAYAGPLLPGRLGDILFLFPAGMVLFRIRDRWPAAPAEALTWAAVCLFGVAAYVGHEVIYYGSFVVAILGLSYDRGLVSRALSSRWLVYGGTISYSLYMTHEVVHKFAGEVIHRIGPQGQVVGGAIVVCTFCLILATAAVAHHAIEVPSNRVLWLFTSLR